MCVNCGKNWTRPNGLELNKILIILFLFQKKENSSKQKTVPVKPAAQQRRGDFKASRDTPGSVEQRRPPLIRVMSAPPTRSFDDSKTQAQNRNKKVVRRRRINPKERDDLPRTINYSRDFDEDDDLLNTDKSKKPTKAKSLTRARSATRFGCDIVTLVSLLSSGESDSDNGPGENNNSAPIKVPDKLNSAKSHQFLRKTGKENV